MKKSILTSIFAVSVLGVILLVKSFRIKNYECISQFGNCEDQITDELSKSLPLSYFDAVNNVKNVMQNNTQVFTYNHQLILPDTIKVHVLIRQTTFALRSDTVQSVSLVDQYGKVVKVELQSNLPSMYIEGRLPNVGEDVGQKRLSQISLVLGLHSIDKVQKVTEVNGDLHIEIDGFPLIIAPTSEDTDLLAGSIGLVLSRLKHILQESKIDMSDVARIDFRYKNPIIVKV